MKQRERGEKASARKWECVQLSHHKDIGRTIEEWESKGWMLHTYSSAQVRPSEINHYLLFNREE